MVVHVQITADALDELAEPLRAHAKQGEDGKFAIDSLPDGYSIEDVKGLKSALTTERDARKKLADSVKSFEAAGLTADVATAAAEAYQKMVAGDLKSNDAIEEFKRAIETKHAEEMSSLQGRYDTRTGELRKLLIDGKLSPIVAAKGGSDAMDAVLTLARQRIQVEEGEDGTLRPVVVGDDGKPALSPKVGSTEPMSFEELVEDMRSSKVTAGLFKVQESGGSGSKSQTPGGGRTAADEGGNKLSPRELIQRANDSSMNGAAASS